MKMIPLRHEKGKHYIGSTEVALYPLTPLVGIDIGAENGNLPPIESALARILPDLASQNPDLLKANSYYLARIGEHVNPRQETPDGAVPEQRIGKVVLQFYKAVPINPENRKSLEDIFKSSI